MSRTEKKVKKQGKLAKQTAPKSGVPDEQRDALHHRTVMAVSAAAIVGAVAFMFVFFTSDIGNKIIQAKSTPAYAAQSHTSTDKPDADDTEQVANSSGKSFHIAIIPGSDLSKKPVIDYLKSLNDDEFDTLMDEVSENVELDDVQAYPKANRLFTSILQGKETDRSDILKQLNRMDEDEFDVFITSVVKAVSPNQVDNLTSAKTSQSKVDKRFKHSLKEAYAEAERKYPGQVDGSKRLKLVKDLNATGYLYYVAEEGDTLLKLSRAFSVPLGQLVELNGIHDADKINAGEILLFPTNTAQPAVK